MVGDKIVEFIIKRSGDVTAHVQGVKGAKCIDLTKGLEESLGKVMERKKTAEYHKEEPVAIVQRVR